MPQIFNSWRDENAVRHYPFTDYGPPVASGLELSSAVFVDANIHPPGAVGGFHLSRIYVGDNSDVYIEIASQNASVAATGVWSSALPDLSVVPLYDSANLPSGVLVVDPAEIALLRTRLISAEARFDPVTSAFVVSTWGFTAAAINNELREGQRIAVGDDLYLVGEDGVRLSVNTSGPLPVVRVHAVGDPLARLRECSDEPVPRFIREVVFQHGETTLSCSPGDRGEIFIVVASQSGTDSALRLSSSPGELQVGFSS